MTIPTRLCCNDLGDPLGVESPHPLFSWIMESDERGQCQTAYEICVSSTPEGLAGEVADLWSSGLVRSSQSTQVPYAGTPLRSRQRGYWKVRLHDQSGTPGPWSELAGFEMGLLRGTDWRAQWIAPADYSMKEVPPAPLLRRAFRLPAGVKKARAYVCGLGYYEFHVNGQRIGDEVLMPAFSRYDRTSYYQTWDVTLALQAGDNVLGPTLGNGWYNCFTEEVWDYKQAPWRAQPKVRLQLEVELATGRTQRIVSDISWQAGTGPIVFDGLRNGETYDSRLEQPGWSAPGFDASAWKKTRIVPSPGGTLRSQQFTPIRVTGSIRPVGVREVKPGVWVFDLGQNIAGWSRVTAQGPAGTTITLRHAEKLDAEGDIDSRNINWFIKSGQCQTDQFILKGDGDEVFQPRFTYHGFQYIQMTGFPGTPTLDSLTGITVHTDFKTQGEFECSHPLLNTIQRAARWSTLGNYHGIPTDCPHREKNGWTGDAHLSAEQVLLNFNPETAYRKWLRDFHDVQRESGQLPGIIPTGGWGYNWGSGPAWDSALILIPWYLYLYRGDRAVLAENFAAMTRYIAYMTSMASGDTVDFGLGDWCPPVGEASDHKCPVRVTDTAYYYVDVCRVAAIAGVLGKKAEAARYRALALKIRKAFQKHFLDRGTGRVTGNSQTSMACALYQDLVDPADQPNVLAALVSEVEASHRHIDCGILGTKYLLHILTDLGRADLAYAIATQTDFPSWGHWFEQGATTLWENWNGHASRNHHMFSDISAWFYRGLAGIRPDPGEPGFKNVIIQPAPVPGLDWVKVWHQSPYGRIESRWTQEAGTFRLEVTIPPNSHGEIHLPTASVASVCIDDRSPSGIPGVEQAGPDSLGRPVFKVPSGHYRFSCAM
jgi:alpha-L-rhamnosidase